MKKVNFYYIWERYLYYALGASLFSIVVVEKYMRGVTLEESAEGFFWLFLSYAAVGSITMIVQLRKNKTTITNGGILKCDTAFLIIYSTCGFFLFLGTFFRMISEEMALGSGDATLGSYIYAHDRIYVYLCVYAAIGILPFLARIIISMVSKFFREIFDIR